MLWQRMQTCKSQFYLTFDFANEVLKVQIRNISIRYHLQQNCNVIKFYFYFFSVHMVEKMFLRRKEEKNLILLSTFD